MKSTKTFVKPILNQKGYSYLEVLFSVIIMINLFVLITQIFYNINKINHKNLELNVLAYEIAVSRIELDLKDIDRKTLVIRDNQIQYFVENIQYRYLVSNNRFTLIMGNYAKTIYYVNEVKSVSFKVENNLIHVKFTDLNNQIYETRIILSHEIKQ